VQGKLIPDFLITAFFSPFFGKYKKISPYRKKLRTFYDKIPFEGKCEG
jgi:hypothetical protein